MANCCCCHRPRRSSQYNERRSDAEPRRAAEQPAHRYPVAVEANDGSYGKRLKRLFSDRLSSRREDTQSTEALIRCTALNRMTQLGMPDSYRI